MITIQEVIKHAETIANGEHDVVKPGQPFTFSEASTHGDAVWQGDFGIIIRDSGPPQDYEVRTVEDGQCLVPDESGTTGSRHCLESAAGVTAYYPKDWGPESLNGPYFKLEQGAKFTHPKHGDVAVPSCFQWVETVYQREWDEELKRERRAAD